MFSPSYLISFHVAEVWEKLTDDIAREGSLLVVYAL
jgi:hypothetical protein